MTIHEDHVFQTALLSCLLLFFSACAWLIPFVAINEDATFDLISLKGDTWYVGLFLIFWFGHGSLLLTKAEAMMDANRLTYRMFFKKLLMVPFAALLNSSDENM
jgi:hypothetical protein